MATLRVDALQALLKRLGVDDAINSFPSADILTRPLDIYRSHLAQILVQFTECEAQVAYDSIQEPNDSGDLEVVVPRLRLKGSNPKELAFELAQKFPETPLFDLPFEDGIHLRLYISPKPLARILLPYILDRGKSYGSSPGSWLTDSRVPDGARRRVIVEFSSPNLSKEFDGAHLRSTVIGSSIASLYDGMGWDVCRLNFLGDWGKHIGLLAVGWYRFGSDELFEIDPLRHLLEVYTKIDDLSRAEHTAAAEVNTEAENEGIVPVNNNVAISAEQDNFFKKMEDGDSDAVSLWKRFRQVCVTKYANLFAQLDISFDNYSGESEVSRSTIAEVEAVLIEKGVYEESKGGWIIDFKKHGSKGLGTVTARHPNGTTSYLLRDVGAVLERKKKYNFDEMIYVVSARQDTHFQQLFRTLELMGDEYRELAQALQHVNFGKVQGLSPQSGSSGLLLGDILEQCQKAIQESLKTDRNHDIFQSHRVNGDGALNYATEYARLALISQELSTKRSNTLNFTLVTDGEVTAPIGNYPGLKVQRWLDNLRSKIQDAEVSRNLEDEHLDYTLFEQEEAYADMLRLIAQYPKIVKHAFEKLEPSTILAYLLQVIEMLSSVWDEDEHDTGFTEAGIQHEDAGEGSESGVEAPQRHNALKAVFYECVRTVLENGMNLIGLVPITKRGRETAGVAAAAAMDFPKELGDEVPPIAMPQVINKEPILPAMPQEDDDKAAVAAEPREISEETGPTTILQEANEGQALRAVPKEETDAAPTTIPQGLHEDAALIALPEEVNRKSASPQIPQEVNEDVPPIIVPRGVSEEERQDPSSTEDF